MAPSTLYTQVVISRRALWEPAGLRFSKKNPYAELSLLPRVGLRAKSYYYTPTIWLEHQHLPAHPPGPCDPQKLSEVLRPFAYELRKRFNFVPPQTQFMVSHACGRVFVRAISTLVLSGQPFTRGQLLKLRKDFRQTSFMNVSELVEQYQLRKRPTYPQELIYWMRFIRRPDRAKLDSMYA